MAFNFNWHPLTADPEFYSRARDLLTAALNKSPKPPIIVADILVTELNLGTTPPDLEILEIGDLADDRFRGIFKMEYSGDAFLTLQTKVQANPLNTYLSTAPSFTSPQPLAASAPLTIPLQITLSDFRLSGFVILVFSKAKGVTLVFRNDPLESLVVSSTFDSIPFIKDYLQKEIEKQLRNLFQEELPAIIHRLSLRWWGQDYDSASSNTLRSPMAQNPTLNSGPSLSAKSSFENLGEQAENGGSPQQQTFSFNSDLESDTLSSKGLLRLATLTDSQRTLSLFTPSIREAIYRAWATTSERSDPTSTPSSASGTHSSTAYSMDGNGARPGLVAMASSLSISSSSGGLGPNGRPVTRSSALGKKKKTRVVNLRRKKDTSTSDGDTSSIAGSSVPESITSSMEVGYEEKEHVEANEAINSIPEIKIPPPSLAINDRRGDYVDVSPLRSPTGRDGFLANRTVHHAGSDTKIPPTPSTPSPPPQQTSQQHILYPSEKGMPFHSSEYSRENSTPASLFSGQYSPQYQPQQLSPGHHSSASSVSMENPFLESRGRTGSSSSIAEKAWMMKMAGEMARRWGEERLRREKAEELLDEQRRRDGSSPPPAYHQSQ
ncbi:ERMES complex subunit [Orbilia oligospora]|uniref:Mitochondrial distribution and morphology protein 34 n=1 Tax=Orbilia oligospora TaxID=2813651 RepID=A0A6G1ME59_ORBOL|nr:ERMES complex subunit [Orbilia oligospora]KAF3222589.1 ERMES complex subunit [Orbilia oligospora]KAF3255231.1 ERMES complex subunit [Orbilia oligospora]